MYLKLGRDPVCPAQTRIHRSIRKARHKFRADFPKYLKTYRAIARLPLSHNEVQPPYTIDDKQHSLQSGNYLLTCVPAEANKNVNLDVISLRARGHSTKGLAQGRVIKGGEGIVRPGCLLSSALRLPANCALKSRPLVESDHHLRYG